MSDTQKELATSQLLEALKEMREMVDRVSDLESIGEPAEEQIKELNALIKQVKTAISNGADIDVQDEDGWTPLIHAVANVQPDLIQFMIKAGAKINIRDTFGLSALAHAVGDNPTVQLLLRNGAEVNAEDDEKNTILQRLQNQIYRDKLEFGLDGVKNEIKTLPVLLAAGAYFDQLNSKSEIKEIKLLHDGCEMLFQIARRDSFSQQQAQKIENAHFGALINTRRHEDGNTPLQLALQSKNLAFAHFLIKNGANVHLKNKEGKTAVDILNEMVKDQNNNKLLPRLNDLVGMVKIRESKVEVKAEPKLQIQIESPKTPLPSSPQTRQPTPSQQFSPTRQPLAAKFLQVETEWKGRPVSPTKTEERKEVRKGELKDGKSKENKMEAQKVSTTKLASPKTPTTSTAKVASPKTPVTKVSSPKTPPSRTTSPKTPPVRTPSPKPPGEAWRTSLREYPQVSPRQTSPRQVASPGKAAPGKVAPGKVQPGKEKSPAPIEQKPAGEQRRERFKKKKAEKRKRKKENRKNRKESSTKRKPF